MPSKKRARSHELPHENASEPVSKKARPDNSLHLPNRPETETKTPTLLPRPQKRAYVPGTLQRLGLSHPGAHISSKGAKSTLSGAKIGGKAKDLKRKDGAEGEEMWVSNKGVSFAGLLKRGVACFLENGSPSLTLHALCIAIPTCMTLAFAIASALPCGLEGLDMETTTESVKVNDVITPEDEKADYHFQTRTKSALHITIKLKEHTANLIMDPMRKKM
ncbi:hypothetical protein BT69DRAFT_1346070 [Atractiella rhizophila]|nr:hypothetical protein BT69DRAFT_1346070 [Atractiella rhizophila]